MAGEIPYYSELRDTSETDFNSATLAVHSYAVRLTISISVGRIEN